MVNSGADVDKSLKAEDLETEEPEAGLAEDSYIIRRPKRAKLTAEESIRRTEDFINNEKRKEQFIASIRKSKG